MKTENSSRGQFGSASSGPLQALLRVSAGPRRTEGAPARLQPLGHPHTRQGAPASLSTTETYRLTRDRFSRSEMQGITTG